MKLRSGKVLLPPAIEKKLNTNLTDLQSLLANNKSFAQELIKVIVINPSIEKRFKVSDMIRQQFSDISLEDGLGTLLATSGSLLRLVNGYGTDIEPYTKYSEYFQIHDIIQERIMNAFDMDISLIGATDQIESTET